MNYNKQVILKQIEKMHLGVKMSQDILETVNEFKHYKQVNNRFCEALKAKGYHSYITKDKYSTTLVCNIRSDWNEYVDFRMYVREIMEKQPITWDAIVKEVERHGFGGRFERYKSMYESFDDELVSIKNLYEKINAIEYKCFDLYEIKRSLRDSIEIAQQVQIQQEEVQILMNYIPPKKAE